MYNAHKALAAALWFRFGIAKWRTQESQSFDLRESVAASVELITALQKLYESQGWDFPPNDVVYGRPEDKMTTFRFVRPVCRYGSEIIELKALNEDHARRLLPSNYENSEFEDDGNGWEDVFTGAGDFGFELEKSY